MLSTDMQAVCHTVVVTWCHYQVTDVDIKIDVSKFFMGIFGIVHWFFQIWFPLKLTAQWLWWGRDSLHIYISSINYMYLMWRIKDIRCLDCSWVIIILFFWWMFITGLGWNTYLYLNTQISVFAFKKNYEVKYLYLYLIGVYGCNDNYFFFQIQFLFSHFDIKDIDNPFNIIL